ncbi:DUF4393 domain-containing protein [Paenibacillus endoradicis]|uniref:DUF4393 domain-containing protein n=1 Tax=Paenibacillus endoradicis TaxID=2972487 RepID=UPI00215945C4|nr:DUF4393 domain-containing protein [Paenibacillus endoradicis]MCR8656918.1 DUF4393 domain-containing protein [Paenibacillus endoradicis]
MDLLGLGKMSDKGFEAFKMIYPDLTQPAVKKVGLALETVFDLCNTILLPLKLANSNSQLYFEKHMDKYKKKLDLVEEDQIITVPPTLGLRVIDELLTVTNDDIAELFLNLLTSASNINTVRHAHPGFIDIIKNLSQDEAKIINEVFTKREHIIYSQIVKNQNGGEVPLSSKFSNLNDLVILDFDDNIALYMDNLIRCALIEDTDVIRRSELDQYKILREQLKDEEEAYKKQLEKYQAEGELENATISIVNGRYVLTSFGKSFINCIRPTW